MKDVSGLDDTGSLKLTHSAARDSAQVRLGPARRMPKQRKEFVTLQLQVILTFHTLAPISVLAPLVTKQFGAVAGGVTTVTLYGVLIK